MWTRLQISVVLGVCVLAWAVTLWVRGTPMSRDHLWPFAIVVSVLSLLSVAFEHILWRRSWLHTRFVERPDLRGTWQVELESDWDENGEEGQGTTIRRFMAIEQSFSKLQMRLMTSESESWFIAQFCVGIRLLHS